MSLYQDKLAINTIKNEQLIRLATELMGAYSLLKVDIFDDSIVVKGFLKAGYVIHISPYYLLEPFYATESEKRTVVNNIYRLSKLSNKKPIWSQEDDSLTVFYHYTEKE